MKKVMVFIISLLGFCGLIFAQEPEIPQETHWPEFNLYEYMDNQCIVAIVQIDNNIIGSNDNCEDLEVGAFVNDTIRGHAFMKYYLNDPYPIVELTIYYNPTDSGKEVAFKLYDHYVGKEYDICMSSIDIYIGVGDGDDVMDYDNPIVLSFFSSSSYTKEIVSHGANGEAGWYLIASPLIEPISPTAVGNMITDELGSNATSPEDCTYDLYYFDQTGGDNGSEWKNYRNQTFNLEPGKGYLYANAGDVILTFTGIPIFDTEKTLNLTYAEGTEFAGWNLVGNPLSVPAYIGNTPYMRMNYGENAGGFELIAGVGSIAPMEGIFVHVSQDSTLTFSTTDYSNTANLTLCVSHNRGNIIDRAIINFSEDGTLPKFQLNPNHTKVYIPQNGIDYAVVSAGNIGEMPVNFKAEENGTYSLSFGNEEVTFSYLHLIDNMAGMDIDLLQTPNYTFNAKTTDYESRFKLVFVCRDTVDDNDSFAFYSNGNLIINNIGDAILQVVDINGRILSSERVNGSVSKSINTAPGIYMIRLVTGENVMTQKVVVR